MEATIPVLGPTETNNQGEENLTEVPDPTNLKTHESLRLSVGIGSATFLVKPVHKVGEKDWNAEPDGRDNYLPEELMKVGRYFSVSAVPLHEKVEVPRQGSESVHSNCRCEDAK